MILAWNLYRYRLQGAIIAPKKTHREEVNTMLKVRRFGNHYVALYGDVVLFHFDSNDYTEAEIFSEAWERAVSMGLV